MKEEPPQVSNNDRIRSILDDFHRRSQRIRALAETQLKHAEDNQKRELEELEGKLKRSQQLLESGAENPFDYGSGLSLFLDGMKALQLTRFSQKQVLAETLFTANFNSLDAFLGQLVRTLFSIRPDLLLTGVDSKPVEFKDVLNRTREQIITSVIDSEVDKLLRQSYRDSFERLATKFKTGTLKQFPNWPRFVECSQRRNVVTHVGGKVSQQYLDICRKEKVKLGKELTVGSDLPVTQEYLIDAIDIVTEVGLKIGHVLWRSVNGNELEAPDGHLGNLIYDLLKREEWALALRIGEFGQECAKRSYRKPRNDRSVKIILINHAQAAKWSGDAGTCSNLIDAIDWSASGDEFRLAVACLREQWEDAADLMRRIGPNSDLMPVHAYIGWPILREFRKRPEFPAIFEGIFGVKFAVEVTEEITEEIKKAGDSQKEVSPSTAKDDIVPETAEQIQPESAPDSADPEPEDDSNAC